MLQIARIVHIVCLMAIYYRSSDYCRNAHTIHECFCFSVSVKLHHGHLEGKSEC